MPYKIVIVDDEPLAIEVLNHYFKEEENFTVINTFTNPAEALAFLNTVGTDVLFLDIDMAVLNGIELLQNLEKKPLVVFTTAHKQYLQEGFDHGILDYLQKPIKKDRLKLTLERVKKQLPKEKAPPKQIHIKSAQKEFYINRDGILFIKAIKDYCLIYLEDGTKVLALGTLKIFMQKNELEDDFIRVHKSFIVPLLRIKELLTGGLIQIADHKIPIGRKYKEGVLKIFNKKQFLKDESGKEAVPITIGIHQHDTGKS